MFPVSIRVKIVSERMGLEMWEANYEEELPYGKEVTRGLHHRRTLYRNQRYCLCGCV
jgi:hypothetical protein